MAATALLGKGEISGRHLDGWQNIARQRERVEKKVDLIT